VSESKIDYEEKWNELYDFISEWSRAYPEEVFIPIEKGGRSPDCYSAAMGRHVTTRILARMRLLENGKKK